MANNLCSDHRDKQQGQTCLACRIEHLQSDFKKERETSGKYWQALIDTLREAEVLQRIGVNDQQKWSLDQIFHATRKALGFETKVRVG